MVLIKGTVVKIYTCWWYPHHFLKIHFKFLCLLGTCLSAHGCGKEGGSCLQGKCFVVIDGCKGYRCVLQGITGIVTSQQPWKVLDESEPRFDWDLRETCNVLYSLETWIWRLQKPWNNINSLPSTARPIPVTARDSQRNLEMEDHSVIRYSEFECSAWYKADLWCKWAFHDPPDHSSFTSSKWETLTEAACLGSLLWAWLSPEPAWWQHHGRAHPKPPWFLPCYHMRRWKKIS